jgi:hypothetical protein
MRAATVAHVAYAKLIRECASHVQASMNVLADIFQFLVGGFSSARSGE